MGKFRKAEGAKQSVQTQRKLHSVHKTIHKNKKKPVSKNKNVVSILQNGKSKVMEVAGTLSDIIIEEKTVKLGKVSKKGKENVPAKFNSKVGKKLKKKGKHGHVASPQQASPSPPQKAKKPLKKDSSGGGGKHSHKQVQLDNCNGKQKRDLSNKTKTKKKKEKQTVRKNFVLLRPPTSSEDEDEDEDEEQAADNETSVRLEHLNATLASSTDSDDDEFEPKEESDAEMSDGNAGDSVVSDDIADLSGDDSTEEPVLEDGGDESDSDEEEDDDDDEESDQGNKNESLKVQHLNATLPSSDDEDEEYVPEQNEAKIKWPQKKKNKDESLNLTALENTINSTDEDDDDYVPNESVGDVEADSSDADSEEDDEESDDEDETTPKKKAKEEEEDSDESSELEDEVVIEGQAGDTKETKEYLASLKPFEEKAFREIVTKENVLKIVKALVKQVKEEMSKKKDRIFADYRYILQVTSFKIPKCPRRMAKLRLTHSLLTEDDDVCFIVRDLERGRKVDYEETVHHYEDLFAEKGIKGIKAIMPFNQIRNEYKTYESKIKLSNLYDYYLCDGAIVGHVVGFLGKHFQKPRSTLHAVRMDNKFLAAEVKKALHKTSFKQNNKGPTIAIPVGHCNMNNDQITENILTIVDQLKDNYPGGLENIRNMNVKINLTGTSSLPIYISFCRPPASVPNVVGPKEKHLKEVKKKTNEILQKFSLTQTGEVVKLDAEQVLKRKKEIKAAQKAKKAKIEEDKKSPVKTKDGKVKSKTDEAKDEKEVNKSLNVSKKDKSLNVSKKEKSPADKSLNISKKESVSPKTESDTNEKSKKRKKPQESEDEESEDEDVDEQEVEVEDDDSDEQESENEDDDDEDEEEEDDDDEEEDDDDE